MPEANLSHAALDPAGPQTRVEPQPRCKVFVSYSHQDAVRDDRYERGLLGAFEVQLANVRKSLFNRGLVLHESEVFIDRERLSAEPKWRPAIETAIAECKLLILLLSDDSRVSKFCVPHEVNPAVRRGVPVVPVLLRPTDDGWIDDPLADGSKLGDHHSGGLPKFGKGKALAVTHPDWKSPDLAWQAVTKDLTVILLTTLLGQRTALDDPKLPQVLPAHLLYLCNQDPQVTLFANEAERWQVQQPGQALATILQGSLDDALEDFADRLWRESLQVRIRALGWQPPECISRMSWPRGGSHGERFRGVDVVRALFAALSPELLASLAHCSDMPAAAAELAAHLADRSTAAVVSAAIDGTDKSSIGDLRAMFECLRLGADNLTSRGLVATHLSKLVLLLRDERSKPGAKGVDWVRVLEQHATIQHVRLVLLPPLGELSRKDLQDWHSNHQVDVRLRLSLSDCISMFEQSTQGMMPAWKRLRFWLASWRHLSIKEADERCPLLRARVFANRVRQKFLQQSQQQVLIP